MSVTPEVFQLGMCPRVEILEVFEEIAHVGGARDIPQLLVLVLLGNGAVLKLYRGTLRIRCFGIGSRVS